MHDPCNSEPGNVVLLNKIVSRGTIVASLPRGVILSQEVQITAPRIHNSDIATDITALARNLNRRDVVFVTAVGSSKLKV